MTLAFLWCTITEWNDIERKFRSKDGLKYRLSACPSTPWDRDIPDPCKQNDKRV